MAQQMQTRRTRQASPERWQQAARRALAEGISVRQINTSGMWTATSGTHANVAYVLEIAQGVVHSCSCPAGTFGDPCCKHAARYYLDAGLLELDDPEPDPPALGASTSCWACNGCGQQWFRGGYALRCEACGGTGTAPLVAQADALVQAAGICDACGGPLDTDAETDEALQLLCGACIEASRETAHDLLAAAIAADHAHAMWDRAQLAA